MECRNMCTDRRILKHFDKPGEIVRTLIGRLDPALVHAHSLQKGFAGISIVEIVARVYSPV